MSLKEWREEFYAEDAHEVAEEAAVAHSLRKWRGLREENLARHEVWQVPASSRLEDSEGNIFYISASTCALCKRFSCHENETESEQTCPIERVNGGVTCSDRPNGPYKVWLETGDPEPMIAVLEKALCGGEA